MIILQDLKNNKMTYISNDTAVNKNKRANINLCGILFVLTPLLILIMFWEYMLRRDDKSALVFYSAVALPIALLVIILFIYVTNLSSKRWNNTIKSIDLDKQQVEIQTFDIIFKKARVVSFSKNEITIQKSTFEWYEKKKVFDGFTIKLKEQELYFVNVFFDKYEDITDQFLP